MSPRGWGDNSQVYAKTVENEKRIRGAASAEALCPESDRAGTGGEPKGNRIPIREVTAVFHHERCNRNFWLDLA
jgi:hypothetical protein